MTLQGEGYYVARGLSFKEAAFEELECKLTEEQRKVYDSAANVRRDLCFVHEVSNSAESCIPSGRCTHAWPQCCSTFHRGPNVFAVSLKASEKQAIACVRKHI